MEILGMIGSCLVLASFVMSGEKKIRTVNIIGAIISVIYGIAIGAFSVIFLNGSLTLIHIYKLWRMGNER